MMAKDAPEQSALYVTRPSLPKLDELVPLLEDIWTHQHVTNNGYFHEVFEEALREYLDVPYVSLVNNGTLALMVALKAAGISGEVITTPFTFVATTQALAWNGLIPVFADLNPGGYNLDPRAVEAAITPRTSAILAVHCYGFPCDLDALQAIADRHDLKLIYDASHCFGVRYKGKSLLASGDMATLSFHGTKVFNTFEGGAIVCHDQATKNQIDQLRNFGITGEFSTEGLGINAKMQEFSSALGVLQLRHIDDYINQRRKLHTLYREQLSELQTLRIPIPTRHLQYNYSYLPLTLGEDHPESMESLYQRLRDHRIMARRYFYPAIHKTEPYEWCTRHPLTNAEAISQRVICLPLYPGMTEEDVTRVTRVILDVPL